MPARVPRFFLDANIFVYTFDETSPFRRARAQELVELALTAGCRALYTENLQPGRRFESLAVVDPF